MKLVLVHGRAQERKDPPALRKAWSDALSYGLARAEQSLPASTKVEFPYYGDLLAKLVAEVKTPLGEEVNAKGPNPDSYGSLRGEILWEIARGAGVSDADISREFSGLPREKGPGNWGWVQAILRALDRLPGLNSRFIDTFTRDVYVYLTFPGVRYQIDQVVAETLGSDSCIVVAHSLGSIVAYNVLCQRPYHPPYPRFITLGSPLGIKAIQCHLMTPLMSPPCIKHWFNAFDDRDLVALNPLDQVHFDVTPSIENKNDVKNFTDNRHGIEGYLADPVVARRIVELTAESTASSA